MNYEKNTLLISQVGSSRYGYQDNAHDLDLFYLCGNGEEPRYIEDKEQRIDRFIVSIDLFKASWGHPLYVGNITGKCTGNEKLCAFLAWHKHELSYAAPANSVTFGLDYIAVGERYGYKSPIKAGLRTAFILSHMAVEAEDPFVLSDEEKAVLIRARTGDVPPEERVEIYRQTICPANLDKLRRMPENTKVRNELFALLDEICKEETS